MEAARLNAWTSKVPKKRLPSDKAILVEWFNEPLYCSRANYSQQNQFLKFEILNHQRIGSIFLSKGDLAVSDRQCFP